MEESTTAGFHSIRCPYCEVYELEPSGADSARCTSCRVSLDAQLLGTLREIQTLPDALGAHPCECGHPEMRRLPDGTFHCSACGSEVQPAGGSAGIGEAYLSGWTDGLFGRHESFVRNRGLARWEDAADRLEYYRGHRAGREVSRASELREAA
jgi:hypothetical protein